LLNMILVVLYNRTSSSAWDEGTPRLGASRAKEVPPTTAGGTGKAPAKAGTAEPASSSKGKPSGEAPAPAAAPASAPPVEAPAIPEKK
jgi:hypothetical protein